MWHRNHWLALGFAAAVGLAGCAGTNASTGPSAPAVVEPIAGTDVHRLILTEEAVGRLGIQTTPVGGTVAGGQTTIPVSSVLYDSGGQTWTYTNPEPRTYVREAVVVARVDNDQWILASGPAPGMAVVTVGAAELKGTEDGVDGAGL